MEQRTGHKTFKYRLKPTPDQERAVAFVVRRWCELYNAAVHERREAWQKCTVNVALASQSAQLPDVKECWPEDAEINAQVVHEALARLDRAFQAFVRRVKNGEKPGYPRLRTVGRYNSFTFRQVGDHGGARLDNGFLVLPKFGRIAVRWSRALEGTAKMVTIRRAVGGWYVCFSCADVPMQQLPTTGQETGIARGIEAFATLADGTRIFHPGWYRTAEPRLKTAQRRVSRRRKGGHRRRKAVIVLAKAHQKVRAHDAVYHEEVQTANMVRNYHLAKSIQDAGWAAFLTILSHTAACAGREVIGVTPAFTSQVCSDCGVVVAKGSSVRRHSCPACGTSLHRDHNAAKNRERAVQARRGAVA
jgi:putative transposase